MQLPGKFSSVRARCMSVETRNVFLGVCSRFALSPATNADIAFVIEDAILSHHPNAVLNYLRDNAKDREQILAVLVHVQSLAATRADAISPSILVHATTWEALTTKIFIKDYSRDELERVAQLCATFSSTTIQKAIWQCSPGKNISYLRAICDRIRAESIPIERRIETIERNVDSSKPIDLPTYRAPGYVTDTLREEAIFDWLDSLAI